MTALQKYIRDLAIRGEAASTQEVYPAYVAAKKAMLLLAGGIDSFAPAQWAGPRHTITIDYGQRASAKEREVSVYVAERWITDDDGNR